MVYKQLNANLWMVFDFWKFSNYLQKKDFDWSLFDELIPHHNLIIESQYNKLLPLLDKWNLKLQDFGNDPTNYNWEKFRSLRLTREEDWSDWFAHIIETSTTGTFANYLFQKQDFDKRSYSNPINITREETCRNFRADVIIEWKNAKYSHVEIKVGDMNLLKTFETSEVFMQKYKAHNANWTNYILLLSNQLPEWENIVENAHSKICVNPLTWENVCISLRRALISEETITWKVWAYTFIGAIEQILIRFKGHLINSKPRENLNTKINILEKGFIYE